MGNQLDNTSINKEKNGEFLDFLGGGNGRALIIVWEISMHGNWILGKDNNRIYSEGRKPTNRFLRAASFGESFEGARWDNKKKNIRVQTSVPRSKSKQRIKMV